MRKIAGRAVAAIVFVTVTGAGLQAQLRTRVQARGFATPVAFVQDPTDRNTQFVVQQNGHIRVLRGGALLGADFLDVSDAIVAGGEQGLLGLAFAPDTASARVFVDFTDRAGNTVVARFRRSLDATVADRSSEFDLRWGGPVGPAYIFQPYANHNGGNVMFGPDGFLYIGMGDGGSGDDPGNRAQTPSELLGKMLRIDVAVPDDDVVGYRIPADNPFANGGARPEIWAFGVRNPWRFSFDDPARGGTGALIIGDVGQGRYEEIDYEPARHGGRNYGWRNREGRHDNVTTRPPAYLPLTEPIFEYDHSVGQSITGGVVYRGSNLPSQYRGRYFFADFIQGRVWSIALTIAADGEAQAGDVIEHTAELGGRAALGNVSAFGIDNDGEIYIVNYAAGAILKVIGPPAAPATPTDLHVIP